MQDTDRSSSFGGAPEEVSRLRAPRPPITVASLPAQRLVEVVDLPHVPDPFEVTVCLDGHPPEVLPRRFPRHLAYLGMVEWAWSPLSSRIDACYLHKGRWHWVACLRDPNPIEPEHEWTVAAYAPRRGITAEQAAVHLLIARWRSEAAERHLDRFHLVGEEGVLGVAQWHAIARAVWGIGFDDAGIERRGGQ